MRNPQNINHWSSYKDPIWAWEVRFDYSISAPQQLLWWLGESIGILHETGLYKIFAVPELGYASSTADPNLLRSAIQERFKKDGVLDLLYFSNLIYAGNPTCDITTAISYFNNSNEVVTEDCRDIAFLQMMTQPWLVEKTDHIYHRKPVAISGAMFSPDKPESPTVNVAIKSKILWITIATYTDIWLPKVRGLNETEYNVDRRWPNLQLSTVNSRRLNETIGRLRSVTAFAGGEWRVDEDFNGQNGEFDENGVASA